MSLLTAKQRGMTDAAQVQTLVKIGRRAMAAADHRQHLLGTYYANPENATDEERAQVRADIARLRAKATAAVAEMQAIASASDDLDLRRRARAARGI